MRSTDTEERPDLPTVKLSPPFLAKSGLVVDGEFLEIESLPGEARAEYERWDSRDNRVSVYQCENCGYLTMSEKVRSPYDHDYACPHCEGKSFAIVHRGADAKNVVAAHKAKVDVLNIDPDSAPNTKAHLTRIKNKVKESSPVGEMLLEVARILKIHRDPLRKAVHEKKSLSSERR